MKLQSRPDHVRAPRANNENVNYTPVKEAKIQKILDHQLYNTHYVEYQVEMSDGTEEMLTEFDFDVSCFFFNTVVINIFLEISEQKDSKDARRVQVQGYRAGG